MRHRMLVVGAIAALATSTKGARWESRTYDALSRSDSIRAIAAARCAATWPMSLLMRARSTNQTSSASARLTTRTTMGIPVESSTPARIRKQRPAVFALSQTNHALRQRTRWERRPIYMRMSLGQMKYGPCLFE